MGASGVGGPAGHGLDMACKVSSLVDRTLLSTQNPESCSPGGEDMDGSGGQWPSRNSMVLLFKKHADSHPQGHNAAWDWGGELIHPHLPRSPFTRCQKSRPPQLEAS